jgi:hypothetical protein
LKAEGARFTPEQAVQYTVEHEEAQARNAAWEALPQAERLAQAQEKTRLSALQKTYDEWVFDDRPCPYCHTPSREKHFDDCAFRDAMPNLRTRPRPQEEVSEGQFRQADNGNGHPPAAPTQPPAEWEDLQGHSEQVTTASTGERKAAKLRTAKFGTGLEALVKKLDEAGVANDYRLKNGAIDYEGNRYRVGALGFEEVTEANVSAVLAALEQHAMEKAGA